MEVYRHTLVCEGPTDANLIPILNWVLQEKGGKRLVQGKWIDQRYLSKQKSWAGRIIAALDYFGGDLLFVHRDADSGPATARRDEIRNAMNEVRSKGFRQPAVVVIPVRMLESWLLFDEAAIRRAAGNPNGSNKLNLPSLSRLEERPDPKEDLRKALETASELHGRRLQKFSASEALYKITDHVRDFSPLRKLPAFAQLEKTVSDLRTNGWKQDYFG